MARGLKFRIQKVEGLYYPCSENRGADQLICVFVFAYAKIRFSHDEAHLWSEIFYKHKLNISLATFSCFIFRCVATFGRSCCGNMYGFNITLCMEEN